MALQPFFFSRCSPARRLRGSRGFPAIFFFGYGPTASKVRDLPSDFQLVEYGSGKRTHCNLGVMFDQISLFGIPIWNYGDPKYVLYHKKGTFFNSEIVYDDLNAAEMQALREMYPDLPANPKIPFWDEFGGKILLVGLWLLYTWWKDDSDS